VTLGASALVVGLWRFRRGTDPHCARCHQNLVGIREDSRCPECGTSLALSKAVQYGAPIRHWRCAIAGALVLTLGVGLFVTSGLLRANPSTMVKWAPDWAVVNWAQGFGEYRSHARTELLRRVQAGSLGQASIHAL